MIIDMKVSAKSLVVCGMVALGMMQNSPMDCFAAEPKIKKGEKTTVKGNKTIVQGVKGSNQSGKTETQGAKSIDKRGDVVVKAKDGKAKYVFYFIGDGMGMGHVGVTDAYMRLVNPEAPQILMMQFPVSSQVRTYSANNPITDSAAGGTALSTGSKTNNYSVGVDAEGNPVMSIASDFMKAGYKAGVTTTVALDDATPSAFYAHSVSRRDSKEIANQAIGSGLTFLGGSMFGATENSPEWTSKFTNSLQKDGYQIVTGIDEFRSLTTPSKILMYAQNPDGHNSGYTIDSVANHSTVAHFTEAALHTLEGAVKADKAPGFFMMIEAGNIDWAGHATDGGTIIKEVLNMQEGLQIAYDFYQKHPDETLIVVTADHDTGGMALGRTDTRKNSFKTSLAVADYQRISKDKFEDYCREMYGPGTTKGWEDMKQFLSDKLGYWNGVELSAEEEDALQNSFKKTFVDRDTKDTKTLYKDFNKFAVTVFDLFNKKMGIGFTSNYHTGNMVPLYAIGVGSELFSRNLNNIDVPMLILKAAGLERK